MNTRNQSLPLSLSLCAGIVIMLGGVLNVGALTAQEKAAVDKLRPLVSELLTKEYMQTDSYLLRWLKAGKFNINMTVEMMRKSNRFRKEKRVDELLTENFESHRQALPYHIEGFDRKGNPVLQLYFGKWDIRKYVLAGKRDFVHRYWLQMAEKLEQKVYETAKSTGKDISQFYYLNDMDGYTLRQHACLQCIPLMLDLVRTHDPNYPHFIVNVTLVNSPRIFSPVLSIMKTIVHGPTLSVIQDYGHDKEEWEPILFRDIAPDQLTSNFGGTKKF